MWDTDLPVLSGTSPGDVKRRLLEEWLRNPFLDEDLHLLEQRLGAEQFEVRRAIDELCRDGVFRAAGARGYMLDADFVEAAADVAANSTAYPAIDISAGLASLFTDVDLSAQSLVESLPFGVVVLRSSGALEMANQLGAGWLGIPLADLDAATFEIVTGVDPLRVVAGPPLSFSLPGETAVEISLCPATLGTGPAVLIVLRDVSLQEEVSNLQAEAQEELFARLSEEMVGPLGLIEQFLNRPSPRSLNQARAAMEQINWFLRDYYLRGAPGADPDENEPPCQL